jgi:hypothetical protein
MYRNNYLVKTPSGIYKSKDAIYKSGAVSVPDFIVSEPSSTHEQFNELDLDSRHTKIDFCIGGSIKLAIRIKYV